MRVGGGEGRQAVVEKAGENVAETNMAQYDSFVFRGQNEENEGEKSGLPLNKGPTNSDSNSCPYPGVSGLAPARPTFITLGFKNCLCKVRGGRVPKRPKQKTQMKKHKSVKVAPNLEGRSLSTRILRSGAKPKLK
ncbi:hypothetical protein PIB30_059934 [Stylosanthes scabra]|uniref:Uncharacterized protein n=1 Tax=Stylosanthes scabra TaxID=79078 RepID=A0ABU6VKM8_9FABA|nr:hypothetical protein [Stylosanthes scabra]